jgi:DNA-binding MarR family transcriptional regulator
MTLLLKNDSPEDPAAIVQRQAAALLEMFYPVHYRGNMALEDEMRGELTRKQAAILWLIRSEGGPSGGMRRKDIFRKLRDWFDISNPAVTKSLRGMMRPPLNLVRLAGNADSGREKIVFLTAKGERFVAGMVAQGHRFLQRLVEQTRLQLNSDEIDAGIRFLRAGIDCFEHIRGPASDNSPGSISGSAGVTERPALGHDSAGAPCGK